MQEANDIIIYQRKKVCNCHISNANTVDLLFCHRQNMFYETLLKRSLVKKSVHVKLICPVTNTFVLPEIIYRAQTISVSSWQEEGLSYKAILIHSYYYYLLFFKLYHQLVFSTMPLGTQSHANSRTPSVPKGLLCLPVLPL